MQINCDEQMKNTIFLVGILYTQTQAQDLSITVTDYMLKFNYVEIHLLYNIMTIKFKYDYLVHGKSILVTISRTAISKNKQFIVIVS